jgi:hypothetical protein
MARLGGVLEHFNDGIDMSANDSIIPSDSDAYGGCPSVTGSPGAVFSEALDCKSARTLIVPHLPFCQVCNHKAPVSMGHSVGCPLASMEDAAKEVERARNSEKWARDRAHFWLQTCRQMHGKIAMLKAENKKLRKKANV